MQAWRSLHSINGEPYGEWVRWPDGRACYVAYRTSRSKTTGPYKKRSAWLIDADTLMKAEQQGIDTIIVCWLRGKKRQFFATYRKDFFGPHSFGITLGLKQRGLPMVRFRINPGSDRSVIAATMNMR